MSRAGKRRQLVSCTAFFYLVLPFDAHWEIFPCHDSYNPPCLCCGIAGFGCGQCSSIPESPEYLIPDPDYIGDIVWNRMGKPGNN